MMDCWVEKVKEQDVKIGHLIDKYGKCCRKHEEKEYVVRTVVEITGRKEIIYWIKRKVTS